MTNHVHELLRGAAATLCAAALVATAAPARAGDLPPPIVRRVRHRTPTRALTPRATSPRALTRPVASRPPARHPAARTPAPRAPARAAAHVATAPRATAVPVASHARPSEPLAWRIRERHSTYVPPAPAVRRTHVAQARPVPVRSRATAVPPTRVAALPYRPAPRTTTWNRPAPVSRSAGLAPPQVRKASPSFAALERSRATSVVARPRPAPVAPGGAVLRRGTPARSLQRRVAAMRHAPQRTRRATAVPTVPGGQRQPAPRARHVLPLVTPPGCSDYG
jgi:hypothetical protein